MDSDSLAAFRKGFGQDMGALAEEHYRHEYALFSPPRMPWRPFYGSGNDTSAAKTVSTYATVGSVLGLGLGIFLAYRIRANRTAIFDAFKAAERPTQVTFANGRTEALPDMTPLMKPSTFGDIAAYTFFAGGGIFLGGETGLLLGASSSRRAISRDPESKARIETAFRKFRADALRTQASLLDQGKGDLGI